MSNGNSSAGKSSSSFHFLAGLGSGLLSAILLQPADLLKTRVQQSNHGSLLSTIRQISSQPNSLLLFWRGTLPSALRTGFGSAIYFTSLNALRQNISHSSLPLTLPPTPTTSPTSPLSQSQSQSHSSSLPRLSNLANLSTGALARAGAGFILMPMTVIKVRYESSLYSYTSIASASRAIYAHEGLAGFFSGFGATAIRDAPYAGLYVLFYEESKKYLSGLVGVIPPLNIPLPLPLPLSTPASGSAPGMSGGTSASINFSSALLSAALATTLTNPFDAIKTRLQLQPALYTNLVGAGRKMLREEGWRCLFDGLGLRMGRKAVSSALAWTVYEEAVRRAEGVWGVRKGGREGGVV